MQDEKENIGMAMRWDEKPRKFFFKRRVWPHLLTFTTDSNCFAGLNFFVLSFFLDSFLSFFYLIFSLSIFYISFFLFSLIISFFHPFFLLLSHSNFFVQSFLSPLSFTLCVYVFSPFVHLTNMCVKKEGSKNGCMGRRERGC